MKSPLAQSLAARIAVTVPIGTLWQLAILVFFPFAIPLPAQQQQSRPNVILILADDQGYGDIGIHGNEKIRTPHLDKFGKEGTEFTRFYVSPVCAPTRASLMTGRYYYRSGVLQTYRGGASMHGDETTIAELLHAGGYRTGIFGKWHLGDSYPMRPTDQGFDEALVHKAGGITQPPDQPNSYFDPLLYENNKPVRRKGYCTDIFFDAAMDFVERNRRQPFFAYIPTNAPHTPLEVSEEAVAPYRAMGLDDTTAKIYAMVENVDQNFGRLIAKLDELDLRRNTLIIFLTDNGPQQARYTAGLRDRKASVYEGGIRSISLWQWPAMIAKPRKIDRMAVHLDVAATVLDMADIQPLAGRPLDGKSLLPLLKGDDDTWPARTLFFQCHRGLKPQRYRNAAVETDRYKLVLSPGTFGGDEVEIPDNPVSELYDLQADPGEQKNLIAVQPEIASDLRRRYDEWFLDVESTRQFKPGVVHLGSEAESETILSRYQDGHHRGEQLIGWNVDVERSGRYELSVRTNGESWDNLSVPSSTVMYVTLDGERQQQQKLESGTAKAVFTLPAGHTLLDAWVQQEGQPRPATDPGNAVGDLRVRRLPD